MGDPVKVFFLSPTDTHRRSLRRLRCIDGCGADPKGWCRASVVIDTIEAENPTSGQVKWPRDDARWPKACERCGRAFDDSADWLVDHDRFYKRSDTGELVTLHDAPPGACWDASWFHDHPQYLGPDGRCLIVRCPDGHDWMVDGRASNCTLPNDNIHKCWVRHGRPEDGTLHVDKNGVTCSAGAGSIATGKWHGFLHNGFLHE